LRAGALDPAVRVDAGGKAQLAGFVGVDSSVHGRRCALAMLATAGRDRATQPLFCAHGFSEAMIARLVNRGLVTMTAAGFEMSRSLTA